MTVGTFHKSQQTLPRPSVTALGHCCAAVCLFNFFIISNATCRIACAHQQVSSAACGVYTTSKNMQTPASVHLIQVALLLSCAVKISSRKRACSHNAESLSHALFASCSSWHRPPHHKQRLNKHFHSHANCSLLQNPAQQSQQAQTERD